MPKLFQKMSMDDAWGTGIPGLQPNERPHVSRKVTLSDVKAAKSSIVVWAAIGLFSMYTDFRHTGRVDGGAGLVVIMFALLYRCHYLIVRVKYRSGLNRDDNYLTMLISKYQLTGNKRWSKR